MAESVQELIVKYKADISDLVAKIDAIEKELLETEQAAENSGKAIGNNLKRQEQVIDSITRRLELLRQARDKSDNPARVQRINQILSEQGKKLDELKGKYNQNNTAFSKLFSGLNIKSLKDQFADLGRNILGAFAVQQVIAFGAASVKAFQEAEVNALKLKNAVGVNGGLQEDYERLLEQSNDLQKVTIFSDDQIQAAQTAALQFGLTADEVENLIPIIADFASATGQDLSSALQDVIQGVNGSERALKKYGVVLSEGGTSAERLSEITDQLNTKFEGQAELVGETSAGAFKKFANQLDDTKEEIGGFISELGNGAVSILSFVLNGFQPLNDAVDETGRSFKASAEEIKKFNAAIQDFQIAQLQQQIATLSAADQDVTELVKQLNALTEGKFKLEISGLSDDQLKARREELQKMPLLLQQEATQLKLINEEIKKRNLDFIIGQKELTNLTIEELRKREAALIQESKRVNNKQIQDSLAAVQEEIKRREEAKKTAAQKAADKEQQDREKALSDLNAIEQAASDKLLALKESELFKIEQLENQKQRDIARIRDAFLKAGSPAEEFQDVEKAVLDTAASYDILIEKEKELQAIQDKRRDDSFAQANENEGAEALQREIQAINDASQERINIREREFLQIGDFSRAAQRALEADLLEIQRDGAQQELDILRAKGKDTLDAETKLLEAEKAIAQQRLDVQTELAQKKKELERQIADATIDLAETIIFGSIERELESRLAANDKILEDTLDKIDQEMEATEQKNERGIIGDREAERIKEDLIRKEQQAKQQADARERQLKRKQFQTNQAAAISEIIIANTVNAAEFPALAAFYAALAIIQSAAVLAEPNPYKKGTKSTESGLSIVGEEGPELMFQPKGNKILSNPKTKANGAIIDAMFDNKLDEYIQKVYIKPELKNAELQYERELNAMLEMSQIAPVLQVATQKAEVKKQEQFATAIANSFILNSEFNEASAKQIGREVAKALDERLSRKGLRVKNIGDLAEPIMDFMKTNRTPSYKQ